MMKEVEKDQEQYEEEVKLFNEELAKVENIRRQQ